MPTSGGEAIQYSDHKGGIEEYSWASNRKEIVFTAKEQLSDEEQKEHDLGADPIYIDEGPKWEK